MLGERDVHHARGLHVPGQSRTVAGTMEGADIDCNARPRHRLRGDSRRHQVLEKLWQPAGLPAGHLPRILQQQTRAKSGEYDGDVLSFFPSFHSPLFPASVRPSLKALKLICRSWPFSSATLVSENEK